MPGIESRMTTTTAMMKTPLQDHPGVNLVASGKVREIYEMKDDPSNLLFVTTDRVSAFDVVLESAVPQKGAVLTMLSKFWFELLQSEMPGVRTHFISVGIPASLKSTLSTEDAAALDHRTMVVKRLEVLPLESICRGYITGQFVFWIWKILTHQTQARHGLPTKSMAQSTVSKVRIKQDCSC